MTSITISIIGLLVNLFLAITKAILGFFLHSTALMAEALHSGMDVISSIVAFLGIKSARKPEEKKYPYGHYRKEPLAGFVIVIFLALSGVWILYEGISRIILQGEVATFSYWALVLLALSTILNEITARLKFSQGGKDKNLALIADAEHDRADVVASIGVLIGFFFIKYFPLIDGFLAIIIGIYILYESWHLGKEITDSLVDKADLELEKKLKRYFKKQNIEFEELKTRKVGAISFADIKLKLNADLEVAKASQIIQDLQKELLDKFEELAQINIGLTSHKISSGIIRPRWGRRYGFGKQGQKPTQIGPPKKGKRIVVPLEKNNLSNHFGSAEYLLVDVANEKIKTKQKVKNIYFQPDASHGVKFLKTLQADEIWLKDIGSEAKTNLAAQGIKIKKIAQEIQLKDLRFK
jgi:cation diffusion facilitator family transporter